MAEPVQLDKAAAMVGKSEVTLRRLVKAGKIPFEKEKTLTGFIYRVDPDKVREFYKGREGFVEAAIAEEAAETAQAAEVPVRVSAPAPQGGQTVRIAVAGESGDAFEYWQKKSELYEEKYNKEVERHSHTREELGVWRGRAEQSQAMLLKLLPSPQEVEVRHQPVQEAAPKPESSSTAVVIVMSVLAVLVVAAAGAAAYFTYGMN